MIKCFNKLEGLKPNTIKTYKNAILKLCKEHCGHDFENLDFLNNFDEVMKTINKIQNLETRKTRINICVVLLRNNEYDENLVKQYQEQLQNLRKQIMDNYEENKKSEKENDNWISWEDVLKVREKVKKSIQTPFDFQKYVIMCIYTMLPPLRNTYTDVKILHHSRHVKTGNYLLITKKTKRFIFHEYKTENCYGRIETLVPKDLSKVLDEWLKINKSDNLLVSADMETPMSNNAFTQLLQKIFLKYTDKKIGTQMLRKIFISENVDGKMNFKNKKRIARKMHHSFITQQCIYNKLD